MTQTQQAECVYLHTRTDSAGSWIWFSRKGQTQAYPMDPVSFASQPWLQEASTIRILGSPRNVSLIVSLYHVQQQDRLPFRLQLGSPWLVRPENGDLSDVHILQRMGEATHYSPSVGGWRTFTERDYPMYALAKEIFDSRGRCTTKATKFLEAHPAWPALSFIETVDKTRAALLLAMILDPRWHMDPNNPDRAARLKSFCGLGRASGLSATKVVNLVLGGWTEGVVTKHQSQVAMAQMVIDTWAGEDRDWCLADCLGPRLFLQRIALRSRRGPDDLAHGVLRASHVFLRYLRDTWLDAMTQGRQYAVAQEPLGRQGTVSERVRLKPARTYSPQLFVPSHFFEDGETVREFLNHMARACGSGRSGHHG